MPVELAGVNLAHLTHVAVSEHARVVRHPVPGMNGDLAQALGRPSVEVHFRGIFYGPTAAEELDRLRSAHKAREPVDFFTESVGEGYFTQVLIARLQVCQRAGYLDQFDFACDVVEYVVPPEPSLIDPLTALEGDLLGEATAFMDDVQNALDQVSQLADLLAAVPSFGDPTTRLPSMLGEFTSAIGGGTAVLTSIRDLF
jgi:hypothetical protein